MKIDYFMYRILDVIRTSNYVTHEYIMSFYKTNKEILLTNIDEQTACEELEYVLNNLCKTVLIENPIDGIPYTPNKIYIDENYKYCLNAQGLELHYRYYITYVLPKETHQINVDAKELAVESNKLSQKSNKISWVSIGIAIFALVFSIVTFVINFFVSN